MRTRPIEPAVIEFPDEGPARSPRFQDVYHPREGARGQAEHVFLRGNGLPQRWAGRRRFVVMETGFGLGHNFLATWAAWRADPQRCGQLVFLSVELHPPTAADLARAHAGAGWGDLSAELVGAWPVLTPNLHLLDFEQGQVRLVLGLGPARDLLPQWSAEVDAFFLDGFAPRHNPELWTLPIFRQLARLAAPGATAATWSVARNVRDHLSTAGFQVSRAPGYQGKRDMTVAQFAPTFTPRRSPGRLASPATGASHRQALVIGAGLAGAAAAQALARQGWTVKVLDSHARPAQEASGNPGALFHGTWLRDDGAHARLLRAASLVAARHYGAMLAAGPVAGAVQGLLQVDGDGEVLDMPADYVQALSAQQAQARAGQAGVGAGRWFPQAGWMAPQDVVAVWLARTGVEFSGGQDVERLQRIGGCWQAVDARGQVLGEAPVAVVAGGTRAVDLLASAGLEPWPLRRTRGQVTWFPSPGALRVPVSGHGYALSLPDGRLLCGASASEDDPDHRLREADERFNLDRLASLTGCRPSADSTPGGRVGWRSSSADRLPVVGAVAKATIPPEVRLDHPRFVPREPGLYALAGLGSRGLTWAPLMAEVLAAWVEGAPLPLEADLLDAIDPARWVARRSRTSRIH